MAEAMYESLCCAICLEPAREAVETVCCHQIGCLKCLETLGKCPTCQKEENFETQPSIAIRRMIDNLPVTCSNECGVKTTRGELGAHLKICPGKPTPCPVAGCDFAAEDVNQLVSHVIQQHPEANASNLKTHLNATLFNAPKVEKCMFSNCPAKVNTDQFWQHVREVHRADLKAFEDLNSLCIASTKEPVKLKNGAGTEVRMMGNGKFYCGLNLEFSKIWYGSRKCEYPADNCMECMKLDIFFRDLAPPQLVTSEGRICKPVPFDSYLQTNFGGVFDPELRIMAAAYLRKCGSSPKFHCSSYIGPVCSASSRQCRHCTNLSELMADPSTKYNTIWD